MFSRFSHVNTSHHLKHRSLQPIFRSATTRWFTQYPVHVSSVGAKSIFGYRITDTNPAVSNLRQAKLFSAISKQAEELCGKTGDGSSNSSTEDKPTHWAIVALSYATVGLLLGVLICRCDQPIIVVDNEGDGHIKVVVDAMLRPLTHDGRPRGGARAFPRQKLYAEQMEDRTKVKLHEFIATLGFIPTEVKVARLYEDEIIDWLRVSIQDASKGIEQRRLELKAKNDAKVKAKEDAKGKATEETRGKIVIPPPTELPGRRSF